MKVKKAIKRIIALGTGLTMLGATVFGAVAADLGDYPSQYIEDGKFDGLMVVGAKASTEDVLGIVDIATSLQFASKKQVSVTGSSTTTLSGDAYQVGSAADQLEMGEYLGEVKSTITSDELGALASKKIRTSKGTTDADQYLKFNSTAGLKVVYERNKDNIVSDYLKAGNGEYMFVYELQLPEGLKSSTYTTTSSNTKVDESDAGADTGYMNDLDNELLYMLGDTFSIVEAKYVENGTLTLTLMGGAVFDTLKEGQTKTYDIDGKQYEVTVVIIADADSSGTDAKVKLMVNGEVTKQLQDGDTDTLEDGTVIGIDDILANEGAEENGEDIVSFYIGANKVELKDNLVNDSVYSQNNPEIDEESIEDGDVMIQASWTNDEAKITSIKYKLKADAAVSGDLYIAEGDTLSGALDEPEGMLSSVWDVTYLGLTAPQTTEILVDPSGDDAYYLEFTTQEGIEYSVPLIDNSNDKNQGYKFGTDEENLVFAEGSAACSYANAPIALDDYFIVSKTADDDKAFTHVLVLDSVDTSELIVSFSDLDGGNKEITYGADPAGACVASTTDLIVGGESYDVWVCNLANNTADTNYKVCVDLNGDGEIVSNDTVNITVKGGAILNFADAWIWGTNMGLADGNIISRSAVNITLTTKGKFTDTDTAETVYFTVNNESSNKADLDFYSVTSANLTRDSDKGSDIKKGMSRYGVYLEEDEPDDSTAADSLKIVYPLEQIFAQVFVTGGDATASTSSSGSTMSEVQRIQVGKTVLDNEVSNVAADNLVVVGGPCVNTVAATLLGISGAMPACYENFPVEEGQGIIKMVENGEKVAVLVAGYSAADTRNAAQVLANYVDYAEDLAGKSEVVVSGTQIMAAQVAPEPVDDNATA